MGLDGLIVSENQSWTADVGDNSVTGESINAILATLLFVKVSDLLRLCLVDFDIISPLKLSIALCLLVEIKKKKEKKMFN